MSHPLGRRPRLAALAILFGLGAAFAASSRGTRTLAPPAPPLAELFARLSEPPGAFDTDNLVSNETAYLQPGDLLDARAPKGGAYIGVGPEQNFAYIARVRPRWAFVLDVRRENLVQQLYLNALLEHAATPLEYLCWLLSRPLPAPGAAPPSAAGLETTLAALAPLAPSAALLEERLAAIGEFLREQDERVSVFYVSNVEFYLLRDGRFDRFVDNVRRLPLERDAVFIRAVFHYGRPHPEQLPGHRSSTLVQPIRRFLALRARGVYASDDELVRLDYLR